MHWDKDTERHMKEAIALGNSHDYNVPTFLQRPPGTPKSELIIRLLPWHKRMTFRLRRWAGTLRSR